MLTLKCIIYSFLKYSKKIIFFFFIYFCICFLCFFIVFSFLLLLLQWAFMWHLRFRFYSNRKSNFLDCKSLSEKFFNTIQFHSFVLSPVILINLTIPWTKKNSCYQENESLEFIVNFIVQNKLLLSSFVTISS